MTVGPDLTVDPAQAYLEQGMREGVPTEEEPHERVAVVVAAGLLAAFALMAEALRMQGPPTTEGAAIDLVNKLWRKYTPAWLQVSVSAFQYALELGSTQGLSHEDVAALAAAYAEALGDYANQSSAVAVAEGFMAQTNAGWDATVAWRRAAAGYGLDSRGMRTYITPLLIRPTSYQSAEIPEITKVTLGKLLHRRALGLADNESYHATQLGKCLVWQFQRNQGIISPDAQKVWRTAHDEKVCPVCGPLDGVAVGLDDSFQVGELSLICPGVHPNCRCRVELSYAVIAKAKDWSPQREARTKRNQQGEFSRVETRVRHADPVRAREAQHVAELLAAAAKQGEEALTREESLTRVDSLTRDSSLSRADELTRQADELTRDQGLTRGLTRDTAFGAMLRRKSKTRNVTKIYWFQETPEEPAHEESVVEEEEIPSDDDGEPYQPNTVVLNGAAYFQALLNHMHSPEGKGRFNLKDYAVTEAHPMFNLKVGSIVDFDAVGQGKPGEDGGWVSPAMKGYDDPGGKDGTNWIEPLLNWSAYRNQIGSIDAYQQREYVAQNVDAYLEEVIHNPDDYSRGDESVTVMNYLTDDDIDRIAVIARRHGASLPSDWKKMSSEERRVHVQDIYEQPEYGSYRSPDKERAWAIALEEVTGNVLADENRELLVAADLQDATVHDVAPDLFVFHGHYGRDLTTLEGQYIVNDIEFHELNLQQNQAMRDEMGEMDYRDDAMFRQVRVFHLEPYEPPWVPQTPQEFSASMPPVEE